MSMPNIPDIKPEINITLEDSVNLLLTSIAEEELSLAGLMDAEKNKVSSVLKKFNCNQAEIGDILSVNESVNQTVINLIKMQMLLQFKLDSVKKLAPPSEKPSKPCPPQKPCRPPEKPRPPDCCQDNCCQDNDRKFRRLIIGKSNGTVSNQSDDFYCCKAELCAFVSSCEFRDNTVTYQVNSDCGSLCLTACGGSIKFEIPCGKCADEAKLCGKATLIIISECKKTVITVNFNLLICFDNETGQNGFKMIIEDENCNVLHDSGFVESCSCGKGLKLCC